MIRALDAKEMVLVYGGLVDDTESIDDGSDGGSGGGGDGGYGEGLANGSTQVGTTYDPNTGEVTVTASQPPLLPVGDNDYFQPYNDGIGVLYHSDGGILGTGLGATYTKIGNFRYTADATSASTTHSNTAGIPPSDTITRTSGGVTYHLIPTNER